jgi:cell division ATPase FtsA
MYALDLDDLLDNDLPQAIGVVGSREFPDLALIADFIRALPGDVEIVSGGARGVDRIAERVARSLRRDVRIFAPQVPEGTDSESKEGRKVVVGALFARNDQIVSYSGEIVAFWDGHSTGTQHTIAGAVKRGKRTRVYLPRDRERLSTSAWLAREREAEDLAIEVADRYRLARSRRRL